MATTEIHATTAQKGSRPRLFTGSGISESTEESRAAKSTRPKCGTLGAGIWCRVSNRLVKPRITPTGRIRAAVFEWANGWCEAGCCTRIDEESGQLDHFFGRAKVPEKVSNCLALCAECHVHKTCNHPDSEWWVRHFLLHAISFDYLDEAERALIRLRTIKAKAQLSAGLDGLKRNP